MADQIIICRMVKRAVVLFDNRQAVHHDVGQNTGCIGIGGQ
jgi:hypothetical protein